MQRFIFYNNIKYFLFNLFSTVQLHFLKCIRRLKTKSINCVNLSMFKYFLLHGTSAILFSIPERYKALE